MPYQLGITRSAANGKSLLPSGTECAAKAMEHLHWYKISGPLWMGEQTLHTAPQNKHRQPVQRAVC